MRIRRRALRYCTGGRLLRLRRRADPRVPGGSADRRRGRGGHVPICRSWSSMTARPTTPRPCARRRARRCSARSRTPARAQHCGRGSGMRSMRGCAAAITLDADGQHDPAEIPGLRRCVPRTTTRARHRPARLRRDAARPAAVEHARRPDVVRGARPERARQPVRLPAHRSGPDAGDARQRGVRLRVRGRDDRPLRSPSGCPSSGCRSGRSTRASRATSSRGATSGSSCGSPRRRGGSPAAVGSAAAVERSVALSVSGAPPAPRRGPRAGTAR